MCGASAPRFLKLYLKLIYEGVIVWIRQVQVIVTNAQNPKIKTVFEKHSIEFEVRSTLGWAADTATVTIKNLSLPEIKFLQNKTFGDLLIEIRAGWLDELQGSSVKQQWVAQGQNALVTIEENKNLPTLFSGILSNAVGYKKAPEHITTLFCVSNAGAVATSFKQMRDIPAGATLNDAIKSMCTDYGYNTVSSFGVSGTTLTTRLPMGRVFHDTFIKEFGNLLEEYNLNFYIATSEIQIFSDTYGDSDAMKRMAKDREPVKIDANSVIGTPIAGIGIFDLAMYLRSDIQPGMVMDVSPLLGTELLANGVTSAAGRGQALNRVDSLFQYAMEDKYQIITVIHRGFTHDQDFQTIIHGVLGGNTASGLSEQNWQNWYIGSGMASAH